VHFKREFNISFIRHAILQKSSATEAQLGCGNHAVFRKGLKVYYLLGGYFDLRLDVLPLLSGEVCFLPLSLFSSLKR